MKILGQLNNLQCRVAQNVDEIRQSQNMRFDVFFKEMSAIPSAQALNSQRDVDEYDRYCDHLLVLDNSLEDDGRSGKIVGSYRLLRQDQAPQAGGFYSKSEFDIEALVARHEGKIFLEFGRSCVLPDYRNKRTIELLWQGSWAYVRQHKIDVMFGCASFEGTDPEELAEPLSFLYHQARAKDESQIAAREGRAVNMNRMEADAVDTKAAIKKLPALIKGYLRLGAAIGGEAVIDEQFGTIDVMIILPVANLNPRYVNYYGRDAQRYAPTK